LNWRFLMIGAKYCTHSLADCSAPSREAASTAEQMNWMGLAKLLTANAPESVPWAG